MRGKRWLFLCLAVCTLLSAGCGKGKTEEVFESTEKKTEEASSQEQSSEPETEADRTFELAFVTDGRTLEFGQINQSAWVGFEDFAEEMGLSHCCYRPEGVETEHFQAAIDAAAENGARLIFCVGKDCEKAFFQSLSAYPDIKFVWLDGNTVGSRPLSSNGILVHFQVEQGAYLAGRALALEGEQKIGFLGFEDDEKSELYCRGFAQGLQQGISKENPLAEGGSVTLYTRFLPSYTTSEEVGEVLGQWKEAGVTTVFAGTEELSKICAKKTQNLGIHLVSTMTGLGTKDTLIDTTVLTDAGESAYELCGQYYNEKFQGGNVLAYDVSTDSIELDMKSAGFGAFTLETYLELKSELESGVISVYNDLSIPLKQMGYVNLNLIEE